MKKSIQYIICIISMVSILSRCGTDPVGDTGGASETVAIIVTDSMLYGSAVTITEDDEVLANPSVVVSLYEADFLPIFSDNVNNFTNTTSSDTNGEFSFRHNGVGYYSIHAKDVVTGRSLFIDSIWVRQGEYDSVNATFDDGGSVSGAIFVIDSITSDTVTAANYSVFITGSPFLTVTDIQGRFTFDTLPRGDYAVRSIGGIQDTSWIVTDSTVTIVNQLKSTPISINPGDTLQNIDIYLIQ